MYRYLRLYLYFLQFSFSKAMEFRVDFFFRVVMDASFYVIQFFFFHVIYLNTPLLGGWDIEQMKIFISGYIFIDALHMTFFANNCWWLPQLINRGDLDYYLVRPVSSLFFLGLREFAANSFLNLIMASSILFYHLVTTPLDLAPAKMLLYVLLLINGAILYFLIHLLFLFTAFWSGHPRGLGDLFFAFSHLSERPHRIFNSTLRFVFLYILPFSLMSSYPADILFRDDYSSMLTTLVFMSMALWCVVGFVWKQGLKNYSSASS